MKRKFSLYAILITAVPVLLYLAILISATIPLIVRRRHPNSMLFPWLRPSLLQSLPPHLSCRFWRQSPLGPFFYHDPGSFLLDLLIRDFFIAMGASHSVYPGQLHQ
jgi:hypothetical protein